MKRTKAAGCALALVIMAGQVLTALATEPGIAIPVNVPAQEVSGETARMQAETGENTAPSGGDPDIGSFRSADGGIYRPGHL